MWDLCIIYINLCYLYYRFIRYNAATKKNEVLMRNLGFANGVKLSDDESFIIVAESVPSRINKYYLKGPKAGQQEVFLDGLPGTPDNIHSDGQGGFLITLVTTIDSEYPNLGHSLAPHPYLRKMLVRLLVTMELPFKLLHDIYPNTYTERIMHAIGSFQGAGALLDPREKSVLLRVDASGNIIDALSSNDGSFSRICGSHIHNDFVWFSTPWLHYIGRVPLKQAFPDLANSAKQSSRTKNEKQSPSTGPSGVKMERVKRTADSTTAKSTESDRASQTKPTAAPTTTAKPTAAPTTPEPTAAPTTSKPTAAPKSAPKVDKPAATGSGNAKPSETKSSMNAETKKDNAKIVGDAKSERSIKKDDAAKVQSGKKSGQDASAKQTTQKSQPEKAKRVETNRPKDDL